MKCKRIFALMIAGLFALSGCGENRTVSEQLSETSQTSQISTEISDCFSDLKQQSEYAEVYQEKINSDYYSAGISDFVKKIEELSGDVSDTQLNEMLAEIQTYF